MGEQDVALQVEQFDLVHDLVGIVDRLFQVVEDLGHLIRRLEIELVVRKGKALIAHVHIVIRKLTDGGRRQLLARVDAQQDIMRVEIRLVHIVGVVRRNDLYIIFFGKSEQHLIDLVLLRHAVALEFHVIIVLEDIEPPFELVLTFSFSSFEDGLRYQRPQATGRRDQSLMVFVNEFLIDPRILAVHPLDIPERSEFHQIPVSLLIFREQDLMVARILLFL